MDDPTAAVALTRHERGVLAVARRKTLAGFPRGSVGRRSGHGNDDNAHGTIGRRSASNALGVDKVVFKVVRHLPVAGGVLLSKPAQPYVLFSRHTWASHVARHMVDGGM